MKSQVKLKKSAGKRIRSVLFGGIDNWGCSLLLIFSDGTFAHVYAYRDEYEGTPELGYDAPLDILDFGSDKLIAAKIVTKKEVEALQKHGEDKRLQCERAQYERLRSKFDSPK